MASTSLSANTIGQIFVGRMVTPPKEDSCIRLWCLDWWSRQASCACLAAVRAARRTRIAAQAAGSKGDCSVPAPPGPYDCSAMAKHL